MMLFRWVISVCIALALVSCSKKPVFDCQKDKGIDWTGTQAVLENDTVLFQKELVYFGNPEWLILSETLKTHLSSKTRSRKKDSSWKSLIGFEPYLAENQFNILFVEKLNDCLTNQNGKHYPYFQRMMRLLGDAYVLLDQQNSWDEELMGLRIGVSQPQFLLDDYFRPRIQEDLELYHCNDSRAFNGPDALAFWIWRHGDETKSLCWSTFQKILSDHDQEWCLRHPDYCN